MNRIYALQTIAIFDKEAVLYVPDAGAVQQAYWKGNIPFPYWSKVWPAAVALGRFLVQHPQWVQNKTVVEFGAGLGLPSLLAARYAASVLCTDCIEEAVMLAQRSADYNRLQNFRTAIVNWEQVPENMEAEVLLLSDVNYDPATFASLLKVVERFLNSGASVILSTPQRLMAKEFIAPLLPYCIKQEEMTVMQEQTKLFVWMMVLEKKQ